MSDRPLFIMTALFGVNTLAACWFGPDSSSFVAMIALGFLLVSVVGLRIEVRLSQERSR